MNAGADHGQIAEFTAPLIGRDVPDPGDGFEDEVSDGGRGRRAGRAEADQLAEPILDLLLPVGDQLLLGREVVVHRLLGDLGLAGHVPDRHVLVAPLGEKPGRRLREKASGTSLFALS